MMRLDELTRLFPDLRVAEVTTWVARGWVTPDRDEREAWVFARIDVARVRLIRDLRVDMGINEDAVPLVLSLLDQIYELRSAVKTLSRAVGAQPETVQTSVRTALRQMAEGLEE